MNEEKNLQNDEEKLREVNPESITTDETNNTEKETRYGYSLFTIFGISFITAFLVNMLLSFALVPTVMKKHQMIKIQKLPKKKMKKPLYHAI